MSLPIFNRFSLMSLYVAAVISFLCELLQADLALEWLLVGVHSEVVYQIICLSESSSTPVVLADIVIVGLPFSDSGLATTSYWCPSSTSKLILVLAIGAQFFLKFWTSLD